MLNETFFNIGDIIIKIVSPFPFKTSNGTDFHCPEQTADFVFYFKETNNIPALMENSECVEQLLWAHEYRREDGTFYRAFLWNDIYYAALTQINERTGICYYASQDILMEKAREGFELMMYLCIEQILLKFNALVLHSSHINVAGKGLVFSAPSQTGKSTQAELWRQYADASILNGDRSVLRKNNGLWYVYGCPMCGTSNIHLQGKEPLSNIVMLAQAKDNQVRKIGGMEAFRLIYPQITIPKWDSVQVTQAMELLTDLLCSVPIWHYSCTKDPEAVMYLKKSLGL